MTDRIDFQELKAEGRLPSPRGVALAVMAQCQDENVSLPTLAHTILGDPVLAGRIIKMANGVNPNRSRPIASVTPDTLILVGVHTIRQAVLGFSLVSGHQAGNCKAFDYSGFWARSTAMACIAQATGAVVRIAPVAELFTCGLLAEVGQLGLATARPEAYSALIRQHAGKPVAELVQAETELFGIGRGELTANMMADWGMPQLFIDAVSHSDAPESQGLVAGTRQFKLAMALRFAAQLSNVYLSPADVRDSMFLDIMECGNGQLNLGDELVVNIANGAAREWVDWSSVMHTKAQVIPRFELPNATV